MRHLLFAFACFLVGAAPLAPAEVPPPSASSQAELPEQEAKLRSFAEAFNAAWETRSRYAKRIEEARSGESGKEVRKMQAKAQEKVEKAITDSGLQLDEYLQLVVAGQSNPEALKRRLDSAGLQLKGPIWAAPRPSWGRRAPGP